ncbi:MAG: mechanosensitive ion channel family protein [Holophaga sp.]|jgi:small-conductance mechanosensitive channel
MLWPNQMVLGNTLLRWVLALGVAAAILGVGRLALRWLAGVMAARADRSGKLFDVCLANLFRHTHVLFIAALAVSVGAFFLDLPPRVARWLDYLLPIGLVLQTAGWGHWGVGLWIDQRFRGDPAGRAASASRAAVLGFLLRLALWSLVLLLVLDMLGFNVTTLVASLGIGGIAVALAVQNILGDLFASLSITLDQPFVIGDFIMMGDPSNLYLGAVDYIGLKTTRIRSLSGEQIVVSNSDLLRSRIRNFKKMLERRVLFNLSIDYRTPLDVVERIPEEVRRVIEAQSPVRFDRAHLFEFADSGLKYEIVYYVLSADYNLYMDVQQGINLGLLRVFRQLGVTFSFPTRIQLNRGE